MKKYSISLFTILTLFTLFSTTIYAKSNSEYEYSEDKYKNIFPVTTLTDFKTESQAKSTMTSQSSNYGMAGRKADLVCSDGTFSIVYETNNENKLYIAKFDRDLVLKGILTVDKILPLFGTATVDDQGNYYILYGMKVDETQRDVANIIIAKYDSNGKYLDRAENISGKMSSKGTKEPFAFANASMVIKNGVIAAHFGRVMFKTDDGLNHQSSTVVYAKIDNMEPVTLPILYCSHSFDQQVIATDTGFAFVDKGDAFPRGYKLHVLDGGTLSGFESFHFAERETYQETGSILGGIAQNRFGYVLGASSVKELSYTPISNKVFQNKNVFIQVIKKNFLNYKDNADKLLSKGVTRKPDGTPAIVGLNRQGQSYFLPKDVTDYGVNWITNYEGKETALNPKIVSIDNDCSVIMWEKFIDNSFEGTYYVIVDCAGNVIREAEKLDDVRLCADERPLYLNGKIIWSVSMQQPIKKIKIYTLSFSNQNTKLESEVIDLVDKTDSEQNVLAHPSDMKVVLRTENGDSKTMIYGYSIGGYNYFKLRDIAYILNNKSAQFNLTWDDSNKSIIIRPEEGYVPVGSENKYLKRTETVATINTYPIYLGKKLVKINNYMINDNSYFKLRDLATLLSIKVDFNSNENSIILKMQ